ncbi:Ribose-5-phosphate isomerase [Raphanus sativus]|nr:Ribose-5-phosphate isomerase [Raphanus sativus]
MVAEAWFVKMRNQVSTNLSHHFLFHFFPYDFSSKQNDDGERRKRGRDVSIPIRTGSTAKHAVGLGTGSTAKHAVSRISELLREGKLHDVIGIPTSTTTHEQAFSLGIPLSDLVYTRLLGLRSVMV